MNKNTTGALGRPFDKAGRHHLPFSTGSALRQPQGSLSAQELRLLVASMVD
jgi:hypothetical protein